MKKNEIFDQFERKKAEERMDVQAFQDGDIVYLYISENVKKACIEINGKTYYKSKNTNKEALMFEFSISKLKESCSKLLYVKYLTYDNSEQTVGFTLYFVGEKDISKYDEKLKALGVEYCNMGRLSEANQRTIYLTLKELISKYNVKGLLRAVWIYKEDEICAGHAVRMTDEGLYAEIRINQVQIDNKSIEINLKYVITHEFGHIINDYISFRKNGIEPGEKNPKYYQKLFESNLDVANEITKDISEADREKYISVYATINSKECIAEAFAMWAEKRQSNTVVVTLMSEILDAIS